VAHGGQNWQDFTTFESVVLGVGGAKFYQDALVKLDPKALTSDTMKQSLETFRRIKSYTDPGAPGRDWNLATAMLIQGKAGFQLMGDWAKGEFIAAGKAPNKDFHVRRSAGHGERVHLQRRLVHFLQAQGPGCAEGAERPGERAS
jgi:glucose/mannose transport system substrate-binding protein